MPEHYPALFRISRSEAVVDRWQPGSQSYGYETFVQRFWDGVLAQFMFSSRQDTLIRGLVKCEHASFRHQTAQLGIYTSGDIHGTPLPIMAIATFIEFIFETFPVRKLYAEVLEFNYPQFSSGEGTFFDLEGRLLNHEIHFGQEWDMLVIALSREKWRTRGQPIVRSWRTLRAS